MTQLGLILISIVGAVAIVIIITKIRAALRLRAEKKKEVHRLSIKPSVSFYLKKTESINTINEICIKNTGNGKALNISISDFYNPDEKDWYFKFQEISLLDPGEEKTVDYDFFVGTHKAVNKTDQVWMFDPEHDHDFAAQVIISHWDIEENPYKQTISIGEENKSSRKRHLQQIQIAMSQSQAR
jgi:hypothetical protein